MATTSQKPKPKRSRMDAAQNNVLIKLMERVDQLSAVVSDQMRVGKVQEDVPRNDQCFAQPLRPTGPPARSIPDSILRLKESVDRLREYRELHASVYGPVITPSSTGSVVGPQEVNQLSNCEVSCVLNELADSIFAITADLRDMASRTQL